MSINQPSNSGTFQADAKAVKKIDARVLREIMEARAASDDAVKATGVDATLKKASGKTEKPDEFVQIKAPSLNKYNKQGKYNELEFDLPTRKDLAASDPTNFFQQSLALAKKYATALTSDNPQPGVHNPYISPMVIHKIGIDGYIDAKQAFWAHKDTLESYPKHTKIKMDASGTIGLKVPRGDSKKLYTEKIALPKGGGNMTQFVDNSVERLQTLLIGFNSLSPDQVSKLSKSGQSSERNSLSSSAASSSPAVGKRVPPPIPKHLLSKAVEYPASEIREESKEPVFREEKRESRPLPVPPQSKKGLPPVPVRPSVESSKPPIQSERPVPPPKPAHLGQSKVTGNADSKVSSSSSSQAQPQEEILPPLPPKRQNNTNRVLVLPPTPKRPSTDDTTSK